MLETDNFIQLNEFNKLEKIGEGGFGKVFKISNKLSGQILAAKISFRELSIEIDKSNIDIKREINIMSKLNNPSILKFYGYSPTNFKGQPKPVIVTEYSSNGSLFNIIELEKQHLAPENWTFTKKLICIYGIAAGMSYLHSQKVLHRDLKTLNILLDDKFYPKIADFGFSKIIHSNLNSFSIQSERELKGTPNYISPEIWIDFSYSTSSDVYAFGMILYEIIVKKFPFEGLPYIQIMQSVTRNERPDIPSNINKTYSEMIEKCWSQNASDRPSFEEILNELRNNSNFITNEVDEDEYRKYIKFIDEYENGNQNLDNSNNAENESPTQIQDNSSTLDELITPQKTIEIESKTSGFFEFFSRKPKPKIFVPDDLFEALDNDCKQLILAAQFDSDSQLKVGQNFIENKNNFPKDDKIGIKYIEESISNNNLESIIYYSEQLIKGKFIQQDLSKAKKYLNKYLSNNDSRIFYLLGKLFKKQKNYIESRKYFLESTKLGNNSAFYSYGKMVFAGYGGHQDTKEGIKYIRRSTINGNKNAHAFYDIYMTIENADNFYKLQPKTQKSIISLIYTQYYKKLPVIVKYDKIEMLYENNSLETEHFYSFMKFIPDLTFEIIYPSKSFEQIFQTLRKTNMAENPIGVHLIIENTKTLSYVFGENKHITKVTVKSPTKTIKDKVFSNFYSLKEITLPDTLKTIGEHSFDKCLSLQTITIPQSVTRIGITSFFNCKSLKKLNASNSIIEMIFDFAVEIYQNHPSKFIESFRYYKLCADQGHVNSMINYAYINKKVLGEPENLREAALYYKLAADKGNSNAMTYYGQMLLRGEGVEKNTEEAIRYFTMSIELGNIKAMNVYGFMLFNGIGVAVDQEKGIFYIKTAADKGNPKAMFNYSNHLFNGLGVPMNQEEALRYLKMASDNGYESAMLKYGIHLLNTKIIKNYTEAIKYFKKLTYEKNIKGMIYYGFMLDNGFGTPVDHSSATRYYKYVIEHGYVNEIFEFAKKLENENSINEAIYYYKMCADIGYTDAVFKYACIYYEGVYVERDVQIAIHYFEIASNQGHAQSTQILDEIHQQQH